MKNLIDIHVSTTGFPEINKAISFCHNNSVNIEISKFAHPGHLDNVTKEDISNIKEFLNLNHIAHVTLHGACYDLFPVSLDKKIVEITIHRLKMSIDIARSLGAKTVIFHSGYNGLVKMPFYDKNFVEKQILFWNNFLAENNINDLIIALENTYENDPLILASIFEGVNSEHFKSCIDTGHVNCYSKFDLSTWVDTLVNHLQHFHIHNNYGQNDQHLSLLDGTLNFSQFFDKMLKLQKPVSMTLEMFDENYVVKSLEFIKQNHNFLST